MQLRVRGFFYPLLEVAPQPTQWGYLDPSSSCNAVSTQDGGWPMLLLPVSPFPGPKPPTGPHSLPASIPPSPPSPTCCINQPALSVSQEPRLASQCTVVHWPSQHLRSYRVLYGMFTTLGGQCKAPEPAYRPVTIVLPIW